MALREYPVLSTVMPLTESAAAFALDKTGLPPLEKLDADYIAPALDHADVEYLDPAIAGLVGLHEKTTEKVVEIHTGVTTKTSEVYTGVSTRVLDLTGKVSETVETVKEKVGLTKAPEVTSEEPSEEPSRASL